MSQSFVSVWALIRDRL